MVSHDSAAVKAAGEDMKGLLENDIDWMTWSRCTAFPRTLGRSKPAKPYEPDEFYKWSPITMEFYKWSTISMTWVTEAMWIAQTLHRSKADASAKRRRIAPKVEAPPSKPDTSA